MSCWCNCMVDDLMRHLRYVRAGDTITRPHAQCARSQSRNKVRGLRCVRWRCNVWVRWRTASPHAPTPVLLRARSAEPVQRSALSGAPRHPGPPQPTPHATERPLKRGWVGSSPASGPPPPRPPPHPPPLGATRPQPRQIAPGA
eukprot:6634788-Prymnesium_polylepis.1